MGSVLHVILLGPKDRSLTSTQTTSKMLPVVVSDRVVFKWRVLLLQVMVSPDWAGLGWFHSPQTWLEASLGAGLGAVAEPLRV